MPNLTEEWQVLTVNGMCHGSSVIIVMVLFCVIKKSGQGL